MGFVQWLAQHPRGTMRRIELDTRLSRAVVAQAAHGVPVSRAVALRISAATGGAVSPTELVFPPVAINPNARKAKTGSDGR